MMTAEYHNDYASMIIEATEECFKIEQHFWVISFKYKHRLLTVSVFCVNIFSMTILLMFIGGEMFL